MLYCYRPLTSICWCACFCQQHQQLQKHYFVPDLDNRAQSLLWSGLKPTTHATYRALQNHYIKFCALYNIVPLPASELTIIRFLAYLSFKPGRSGQGLAPSTLTSYLSAIRSYHLYSGYDPPPTNTPRVALMLKTSVRNAPPPVQKQPITFPVLVRMWDWLPNSYDGKVLQAMWALQFFACLRGGELSLVTGVGGSVLQQPPKLSAVTFGQHEGQGYMVYSVPTSKTCPQGFYRFVGHASNKVCGVCTMLAYLEARRLVAPSGGDSPLFIWSNGSIVNKSHLNKNIKSAVSALGLDPNLFSTHSMRAGAVSQGCHNLPQWQLAAMGGWRSTKYYQYIRNIGLKQLSVARILANTD